MNNASLQDDIIQKIKKDALLTGILADHLSVSYRTLLRYLDENDPILTQLSVLRLLQRHFGHVGFDELVNEPVLA